MVRQGAVWSGWRGEVLSGEVMIGKFGSVQDGAVRLLWNVPLRFVEER